VGTPTPDLHAARRLGSETLLPKIRVAAIDLDGTLLDSRHRLSAASRAAIKAAREAGIRVLLASSRTPAAMWPILRELHLLAPAVFVASQGAVTGSYAEDGRLQILRRSSVPLAEAHRVFEAAMSLGVTTSWFTCAQWTVSRLDDHVRREAAIVGLAPRLQDLSRLSDPPDKLMFMVGPDETHRLVQLAAMLPDSVNKQLSNPTYLEVTSGGVDKGSTIQELCRSWNVRAEEVVALGDGPNDLGMFDFAATSIAPANARAAVLAAATFVTSSNDDDGVAYALNHILNQRERHDEP
jgi:Cof subfamily protein (haloacid dehalogenase superfamily)